MAGRGLGTLTLDLAVKTGMFTAGLDKAGRELDSKTRKMQKRAYDFGRAIGTSIKVGFGIAAAGMAIYVKNTIEAEKVQAQLVSRLKDTGQAAGRTLAQLNAQSAKLMGSTVFDDEDIGKAQAALLTFTQVTGDSFDRAVESATDLATVMGTDVADAAKVLGKALSDPLAGIGALRKAGVTLTADQKALVKGMQQAGDIAGAQGVILDALAGKMGTAAEAARNTLGGALQALTNSFNELLEGNSGDDGMIAAREAIESLNTSLNSPGVREGFNSLITLMATAAEKAAVTVTALANLALGVDAFGRSAAQANYDSGLAKEEQLRKDIAAGGRSPFAPGGGRTVETLMAQLTAQKRENAAYRAALTRAPAAVGVGGGSSANGTTVIHSDPSLWKKKGSSRGGGKSDAQREAEQLAEAYARMKAQMEETLALHGQNTEAAKMEYQLQADELLKNLLPAQKQELMMLAEKQDRQAEDDQQREKRIQLEEEERKASEDHKKAVADLLSDIAFETSLLGLNNNEREKAIALRHANADAASAEGMAITGALDSLQQSRKYHEQLTGAMDDFRSSFEDSVTDVLTGAKSIGEAFKSLADQVAAQISRMLANQLTESLFGAAGDSKGGSAGGWLSSIFSVFLPHHAAGTNFAPGGPSVVGEHGPEIVNLPRGAQVIPNSRIGSGGGGVTQNFYGPTTREVVQYAANRQARELALSRRG